jgi:alpha-beta hydrolase superfamily lysophospholipase
MSIENTRQFLQIVHQLESEMGVKNEPCRSKFLLHPHKTRKVFLFLHGFTAGPYQFQPLGNAFFQSGYNVLIPLLPGHGVAGEWNRKNPQPLPTNMKIYQDFVLRWWEIAQSLGEKVIIGGLSTGATLAAWLAFQHPQEITQALLFTPYLGSRWGIFDWLIKNLPIHFEWFNKNAPGNFGYNGFPVPALKIFLELGEQLLEDAETATSPPTLIMSSEADSVVKREKQEKFFQLLLKTQPKSWYYCFDNSLHVEHRMMTKMEDNDYEELLITIAQAFVESDLTWEELQQIAHRLDRGEDCVKIQTEFNIDSRGCKQLSAMGNQVFGCHDLKCIDPD